MKQTETPQANRLHIALFGRRNSGKSSLVNAITQQDVAIVSDTPGTTTDPVSKAMEIYGLGACLFIDTPGFDDEGELGAQRVARTIKVIERADVALLLCQPDMELELPWLERLKKKGIPVLLILNKADIRKDASLAAKEIEKLSGMTPLIVSATTGEGIELVREAILENLPEEFGQHTITGTLVKEDDLVLLVMTQDSKANKGCLILPQVQTLRELLDKKCIEMSCNTDKMAQTIKELA